MHNVLGFPHSVGGSCGNTAAIDEFRLGMLGSLGTMGNTNVKVWQKFGPHLKKEISTL